MTLRTILTNPQPTTQTKQNKTRQEEEQEDEVKVFDRDFQVPTSQIHSQGRKRPHKGKLQEFMYHT